MENLMKNELRNKFSFIVMIFKSIQIMEKEARKNL
jgi:hypothetical protein